jgi:glycosyltransferase involved in cell wall biosynthesis
MSVYNGISFLERSVGSILGQTFRDFEVVVVDDGSDDGSAQWLDRCAQRDARVVVIHQENRGLTRALNRALGEARGRFVARQDADDWSVPRRLEVQRSCIDGVSLVVSPSLNFSGEERRRPFKNHFLRVLPDRLLAGLLPYGNFLVHGAFFFVREDVLSLGGYREHFRYAQDYDLLLRTIERHPVRIVRKELYGLEIRAGSVSRAHALAQARFAALASLLARERRLCGEDRYGVLQREPSETVLRLLAERYPIHAWAFFAFNAVMSRDPALWWAAVHGVSEL